MQFIGIALGSAAELHTQLLLSKELTYLSEKDVYRLIQALTEIQKMLSGLKLKLRNPDNVANTRNSQLATSN